jgi:predicted metal-dependent HD superfamily phosphohydrolase
MVTDYLYEKWKALTRHALPEKAEGYWLQLKEAYTEPNRQYHTLQHLYRMFQLYEANEQRIGNREAVQWAIFFHDAVYRPGAGENEAQSAGLAERVLKELGAQEGLIALVREYILATRDHYAGGEQEGDGAFFLDFDLAILAAEPEEYDAYVKGVRQEYRAVPDAAFRAGRGAFVQKLLLQPRLFFTPEFRAFEEKARANLTRELQEWLWHS